MVLGSGKKLAASPVWNQWHTTTPFSSPDTTRSLSTGDQCSAETGFCEENRASVRTAQTQQSRWEGPTGARPHLMSQLLPDQRPAVGVPEADAAVGGGADADVVLTRVLAEGEARYQVRMAHQLPCRTHTQVHSWISRKKTTSQFSYG